MDRKEIRRKVETKEFLRETFDYDERGFLTWKEARGSKIKSGMIVGFFNERQKISMTKIQDVGFSVRRLIWLWHGKLIPENFKIGSVNGDCRDTRIENLTLIPHKSYRPMDKSAESNISYLRTLFDYYPDTGVLAWKVSRSNCIKAGDVIDREIVSIDRSKFYTSRICFTIHHGRAIGEGMIIDHINGNHRDNRAENLREATFRQNSMNSRRNMSKKSGLPKGVYKCSNCSKFEAQIDVNGKRKYLGIFSTIVAASNAYQTAAIEHFGEYACFDR